ncbi:MAG: hypothetical protein HF978_08845 [Desulfobacteraceae bacterium]|nr:hypothetical protein [Desulfobacteraceae bacterium]MBC2755640.1 hypothetical protein [Desulfobacteraceae bacterium]
MKKIILTLIVIFLFSVSGWASEQETPESSVESSRESSISDQEMIESTPETSDISPDTATADEETAHVSTDIEQEKPKHSFGHKLLFYIPNRILDIFDPIRLRLRVGPGIAVGARVTKPISAFIGGYSSIYAGLPGPRMAPIVKLPVGIENYSGMGVSFLDTTGNGSFSPNYSPTEIGASFQLLIVGADIGVDPVEVLDLATGFIFIDIRGDDL